MISARLLWRDFKSGELTLLVLSLCIAVATVTAIGLFASRIENSLMDEASQALAGDAQLTGNNPIPAQWLHQAEQRGLTLASATEFRAMAFAANASQLASIKAVSSNYPLKGALSVAAEPFGAQQFTRRGPAPGEAWLTSRLFGLLEVTPGEHIEIGEARFRVTQALIREPDNNNGLFGFAPRILIHEEDVAATGAVQPGSRIRYRAMLAGDDRAVQSFREAVEPSLGPHYRWLDVQEADRSMGEALGKAQNFLYLSSSLAVLLASVAIALAGRRYAGRHIKQVALLKTLGLSPRAIGQLYLLQLAALAALGVALGVSLGWLCHWVIAYLLRDFVANLAAPSLTAYWMSFATGALTLLGFAAPPLLALRRVTPAAVLRSQQGDLPAKVALHIGIGLAATLLLIWLYSSNLTLTLLLALGTLLCLAAAALISGAAARLIAQLGRRYLPGLRLGFANLERHRRINTPQITLFAILFMLLFTLVLIRTSLLETWQQQLPPDAPNHFVFNIFPEEKAAISEFFTQAQIEHRPFFPMVRGRLAAVGEKDLDSLLDRQDNEVNYERELYLTWTDRLGSDNRVIEGQWWSEADAGADLQVSLEKSFAEGLDIGLGDLLRFSVSGEPVEARVGSIREVQWDSMNPNFYVIFNRPILEGVAANWLTSFHLGAERKTLVNDLVRQFPTVTLIEVDQTIQQIQAIVERVSRAVEFIWLLVLGAGVLVLITGVQSTLDTRLHEGAVLRTLGASRPLVRKLLITEFASIGLTAGLLAVIGTELVVYLLQRRLFDLPFSWHPALWILGPLLAIGLIAAVGLSSTRSIVRVPPVALLRRPD